MLSLFSLLWYLLLFPLKILIFYIMTGVSDIDGELYGGYGLF